MNRGLMLATASVFLDKKLWLFLLYLSLLFLQFSLSFDWCSHHLKERGEKRDRIRCCLLKAFNYWLLPGQLFRTSNNYPLFNPPLHSNITSSSTFSPLLLHLLLCYLSTHHRTPTSLASPILLTINKDSAAEQREKWVIAVDNIFFWFLWVVSWF